MKENLRVALFTHEASAPDEGVRMVGAEVSDKLGRFCTVKRFGLRNLRKVREIRGFEPDICHFFLSFSDWKSVIMPWILCRVFVRARLCISAIQPRFCMSVKLLLRIMKPDLVIVQSSEAERFFRDQGVATTYVQNGVDRDRFFPVEAQKKEQLRDEFGLPANSQLILHVGALREARGVSIMEKLTGENRSVLIVGRASTAGSAMTSSSLVRSGCIVLDRYLPNIAEVYQMSDIYVFPTEDPASAIDLPLSVIEAVSSGLLVISTRFRGIPEWIDNNHLQNRVILAPRASDIPSILERISDAATPHASDEDSSIPDWSEVEERIHAAYETMCDTADEPKRYQGG